jgi:hypothetical protein
MSKGKVNRAAFKAAMAQLESSGGKLLDNPNSSAVGKYHFLYSIIKDADIMKGVSKREFMKRPELQEQVMDLAIDGELQGYTGYTNHAENLMQRYNPSMSIGQLMALTHYLGPSGASKYLKDPSSYNVSGKVNMGVEKYMERYKTASDKYISEHKIPDSIKFPPDEIHGLPQPQPAKSQNSFELGGEISSQPSRQKIINDDSFVTESEKPTRYDDLNNKEWSIENRIDAYLGGPSNKYSDSEHEDLHSNINYEVEDRDDAARHMATSAATSKAIQDRTGNIPGLSHLAGYLGSNYLGAAHEVGSLDFKNGIDGFLESTTGTPGDLINNLAGSVIGSLPISNKKKGDKINHLLKNKLTPDGLGNAMSYDIKGDLERKNKKYANSFELGGDITTKKDPGFTEEENKLFGGNSDYINKYFEPVRETPKGPRQPWDFGALKHAFKGRSGADDIDVVVPEYYDSKNAYKYLQDLNPGREMRFNRSSIKANDAYNNKFELGGGVEALAEEGLIEFNNGGSHAENPLGGIPLGQDAQGNTNLVEENETKFSFDDGDYIFSDKLGLYTK